MGARLHSQFGVDVSSIRSSFEMNFLLSFFHSFMFFGLLFVSRTFFLTSFLFGGLELKPTCILRDVKKFSFDFFLFVVSIFPL